MRAPYTALLFLCLAVSGGATCAAEINGSQLFWGGTFKDAQRYYESMPREELYASVGDSEAYLDTLMELHEYKKGSRFAQELISSDPDSRDATYAKEWLERADRLQEQNVREIRIPLSRRSVERDAQGPYQARLLHDAYYIDIVINGKHSMVQFPLTDTDFFPEKWRAQPTGVINNDKELFACSKSFLDQLGIPVTGTPRYDNSGFHKGYSGPYWDMNVTLEIAGVKKQNCPIVAMNAPLSYIYINRGLFEPQNFAYTEYFDFEKGEMVCREWQPATTKQQLK